MIRDFVRNITIFTFVINRLPTNNQLMSTEKDHISRIRDILIGNNITEIEKRFQNQEAYFRDELQLAVRNINELIDKNRSVFEQQLQKNEKEQLDAHKKLLESLTILKSQIETLADNSEAYKHLVSAEMELLKKRFEEELHQQKQFFLQSMNEMQASLLKKLGDVQLAKLDKSAMALIMSEMAFQLSEQSASDAEGNGVEK